VSDGLDALLRPRSVAIVGASSDPTKRGYQVVPALREAGFQGDIQLVNPRGGEILGLPVATSVEALPRSAELALLCTPAPTVPGLLEACAARGVGAAVVLATGFRESGPEGAALQERVGEVARRSGIRVVGPNTSGILNMTHGLNLIGARGVRRGSLALLLQSGNVALALMTEISERSSAGISVCVGIGNETDVGFHEVLDWLGDDPETDAVLMYADGFRDPRAVLQAAARLTPRKPVVLLGAGRTRAGVTAARSHTGALSAPHDVLAAGLRQAGVAEVVRSDELLPVALALAGQPVVAEGRGVAILSDGGGHGVLAVDALVEAGTPLAALGEPTREALRDVLGPVAAVGNPVDVGGPADADPLVFARVAEALAVDPGVGGILVIGLFGGYHIRFEPGLEEGERRAALAMSAAAREAGIPILLHSMYALRRSSPLRVLEEEGVPVLSSLDAACTATTALVRRGARLARPSWPPPPDEAAIPAVAGRGERGGGPADRLPTLVAEGRTALTEPEARELLAAFGVAAVEAEMCRSAEEAAEAAASLEGPAAVKLVSREILHKTEAGGVVLGVHGPEEARAAFQAIRSRAPALEGVLVAPMLPDPVAQLLVGVRRDRGLGPILTLGAGGTAAELLGDVAHRVLPVRSGEVEAMVRELRTSGLLLGARGAEPVDLAALEMTCAALARCLAEVPEVSAAEINPLFLYAESAVAVDARVLLGEP
jgi:acyl-CoA synthetase (NDP forming)